VETIQISISDPHYRAALERMLGGSGSCKLIESEIPDFKAAGVVVMDDRVLGRLVSPLSAPERVVLITHNAPERLSQAWEAGIRSVIFYEDSMNTAVLAIMSASLRLPKPKGGGSGIRLHAARESWE
jgi:hypothetical protein